MKDFLKNGGNLSNNSIYEARIREADLSSQDKLQEIQEAADELARQAIIDKLKQAEVEYEKLKLEFEQEAYEGIDGILSYVELSTTENEATFTSGIDGLLAKLFKFFNFMDSELRVETDPQVYNMLKKHEEGEASWIVEVIKFLRDKFNKLIKAIFSCDLSFQQKIDKEIRELCERLFGGSLSPEEEAAILERLEALRDLKLKLQIFVVGSVIAMFAELFSVELTASVKTTKEEGKEKASAKEAAKEVRENLKIKVDAKEKPQLKYDVIPALDAERRLKKSITLTKSEHNILSDPLRNLMHPVPKDNMDKGNSGVPKPEVERKQEDESRRPTQPPQKPNVDVPPKKKQGELSGMTFGYRGKEKSIGRSRNVSGSVNSVDGKGATSNNQCSTAGSFNKEEPESTDRYKTNDFGAKLAAKVAERNARKKCAEASTKHNYPIDHSQVPSETNGKSHANAKSGPQPKSECSSIKINNHAESIGNAQEEVSRGI